MLSEYLPPDYVHHLALLIASVSVLLSDRISKADLDIVEELLCVFQELIPVLYSPLLCTANMHSLIHLVQVVCLWGPLWGFSMFAFEYVNGYLGHGTGQILKQIVFQLRLQQSLPNILNKLKENESDSTRCYIENTLHPTHRNMHMISPNIYLIGKLSYDDLTQEKVNAVTAAGINTPRCLITRAGRCMIKGVTYYSSADKSRNDTVCSFKSTDGLICYGVITSFCISSETVPFVFLQNMMLQPQYQ